MKRLALLLALGLACGATVEAPPEQVIGRGVMFRLDSRERRISPLLPMQLGVIQEQGGLMDGPHACDVVARKHEVEEAGEKKFEIETILKCGDGVFRVQQMLFEK